MIKLERFSKQYKKNSEPAVCDVNLECRHGITSLIGLNGAGKTTILKAVTGLHYATSGKVLVAESDGNYFNAEEFKEKAKNLTGFVPETLSLPLKMTVKEFLAFTQKLYSPETDSSFYNEQLENWDLTEVQSKKIGELSKGFKQRVAFAQAFIHNPENLILDEPVNGLDPVQILKFREILKKESEKRTILISTHLMQEVHSLCDNIFVLHKGKLICSGTEKEILEKTNTENLDEAFLKLTGKNDEK